MWGGPPQTSLPSLADLLSAAGLCLVLGLVRDVIGALWASFQRDPAGAVYVSRAGVAGAGARPGYTAPRRPGYSPLSIRLTLERLGRRPPCASPQLGQPLRQGPERGWGRPVSLEEGVVGGCQVGWRGGGAGGFREVLSGKRLREKSLCRLRELWLEALA